MKTAIEIISARRKESIEKRGRTPEYDYYNNPDFQLSTAACILCYEAIEELDSRNEPLFGWDLQLWQKMYDKPYKERLEIAADLLCGEIDRLSYQERKESETTVAYEAAEYLREKGLVKEGFSEFIIRGDFGEFSLTELMQDFADRLKQ